MMPDILKLVLFNFRYNRSFLTRIPFISCLFPIFILGPALINGNVENVFDTINLLPSLLGFLPMLAAMLLSQQAFRDRLLVPTGMKEKFFANLILMIILFLAIMILLGLCVCLIVGISQFTETPIRQNPFSFFARIGVYDVLSILLLLSLQYLVVNYFKSVSWAVAIGMVLCIAAGGLTAAYNEELSHEVLVWVMMVILTVVCFYFSYRCFLNRNYGEIKMNIARPM